LNSSALKRSYATSRISDLGLIFFTQAFIDGGHPGHSLGRT
jgi:hypothetical protein